jgi:hypothetical protein
LKKEAPASAGEGQAIAKMERAKGCGDFCGNLAVYRPFMRPVDGTLKAKCEAGGKLAPAEG